MSTSIEDVSAEQLARLLHHYHHALPSAPPVEDGCEGDNSWEEVPTQEKQRLVAAARLALFELASSDSHSKESRRYFAKPGQAEMGVLIVWHFYNFFMNSLGRVYDPAV